jgi:hypothetical protein
MEGATSVMCIKSSRVYLLLLLLLVLFIAAAFDGIVGTEAWFRDASTIDNLRIETGTLEIAIQDASWVEPPGGITPGETMTIRFEVQSTGTLPLYYSVHHNLEGDLAAGDTPCYVSDIRPDNGTGFLSGRDGEKSRDVVEIDITMPADAVPEYQARTGLIHITVHAQQQ